jgi:hypothetical protein
MRGAALGSAAVRCLIRRATIDTMLAGRQWRESIEFWHLL